MNEIDLILEQLGLKNTVLTPFTKEWIASAASISHQPTVKAFLTVERIESLNELDETDIQWLSALPENERHPINYDFDQIKYQTVTLDRAIAMALMGYEIICNECGGYVRNELDLVISEGEDDNEDVCPHCKESNGLMDIIQEDHS